MPPPRRPQVDRTGRHQHARLGQRLVIARGCRSLDGSTRWTPGTSPAPPQPQEVVVSGRRSTANAGRGTPVISAGSGRRPRACRSSSASSSSRSLNRSCRGRSALLARSERLPCAAVDALAMPIIGVSPPNIIIFIFPVPLSSPGGQHGVMCRSATAAPCLPGLGRAGGFTRRARRAPAGRALKVMGLRWSGVRTDEVGGCRVLDGAPSSRAPRRSGPARPAARAPRLSRHPGPLCDSRSRKCRRRRRQGERRVLATTAVGITIRARVPTMTGAGGDREAPAGVEALTTPARAAGHRALGTRSRVSPRPCVDGRRRPLDTRRGVRRRAVASRVGQTRRARYGPASAPSTVPGSEAHLGPSCSPPDQSKSDRPPAP